MIKRYLRIISWLGINESDIYEDSKRIEFSNQICCFYLVMTFFYVVVFLWIKLYIAMAILILTILIYLLCFVLTKRRFFKASNTIIFINATLAIYFSTAITGKDVGGQFFLVFLIPLVGMLFQQESKFMKALYILLPLFAFVLLEMTDYQFLYQIILPPQIIKFLSISVFFVTCFMLYFMFQFYINIFQHVRNSLNQMVALYPLTEREIDIISILVKGKSNKEIGRLLFIEENTVKNHLKNIFMKLSVKTRSELMAKCMSIKL